MEWVDFGEVVNFIAFGSFVNKPPANIEERSVANLRKEAAALLCRQADLTINAVFEKAVCFDGKQWPLRATDAIEIDLPDVGEGTAETKIPKTFETINDFLKRQEADGMDLSGYVISIKNENEAVAFDINPEPANPEFYFSSPHFLKSEIESRFPVSLLERLNTKTPPATEPTAESIEKPMTQQERGSKGGKVLKANELLKKFIENFAKQNQSATFEDAWNIWKKQKTYAFENAEINFTETQVEIDGKTLKKHSVTRYFYDAKKVLQ